MRNSNFKILLILLALIILKANPLVSDNLFLKVNFIKNPSKGHLFLSDGTVANGIINNYGRAIDSLELSKINPGMDFRIQADGSITYNDLNTGKFYKLNSKYKVIDSFEVAGGYETDFHEFIINADGSYYMLANRNLIVDLSERVQDGNKEAFIIDQVIQKFNSSKQLIWSFSMYENVDVLDASDQVDFTKKIIDAYHVNAIDTDPYGNIYVSVRNFTQIMKINVATSSVVWRFGGSDSKKSDFTIINDDIDGFTGISNCHDVKYLPNGNILLIDNGNTRTNPFSRAVEYRIDEAGKTIEKVWEFIPSPRIFAPVMGSVQRLENGNTYMAFGNELFEVNKYNETVFQAVKMIGSVVYRSYKNNYKLINANVQVSAPGNFDMNQNGQNTFAKMNLQYVSEKGYIDLTRHNYKPQRYAFDGLEPSRIINQRWVIESDIDFVSKLSFDVKNFNDYNRTDSLVAYARDNEDKSTFKRIVSTFNKSTGIITLDINKSCEFIITSNEQIINSRPDLLTPRNNEITSKDITFKWSPIQYADQYEFQLSDQSDFKNIIYASTSLTATSVSISNLINGRSYLWRVRAKAGPSTSQWSDVWNLKVIIGTPNLVYPVQSAKAIRLNDMLRWSQIKQSSYYDIQVAKDVDFNQIVLDVKGYLDSSVALSKLENRTNYFWRVRAGNIEAVTAWSNISTFRTELLVPSVNYPTNNSNAIPINLNLDFTKSKEADYYQVLLAEDDNFYNPKSLNISANQNNANFQLDYYKNYVAKVRSISYLDTSRWSEVVHFKTLIQKPELKFPLRFMMLVPIPTLFILSEVKDATGYELNIVSVLTEKLPKEEIVLDTTFVTNSYNFMVPFLDKKTTNKWRARTVYQYGKSEWTDFSEFSLGTAGILNPPSLSLPLNKSNSESLNGFLTWDNTANDITTFRVILAEDENFDKILIDEIVSDKKFYYKNLFNSKDYYWKVASVKDGEFSEWTATWQFTTKATDVISTPKLIMPENKTEIKTLSVDFVWEKLAQAISYDLQISTISDFTSITKEEKSFPGYNYNFANPTPNTEYFWRVRATQKDSTNAGIWSETFSFKMAEELTSIEEDEVSIQISNIIIGKDYILRDIKGAYVALAENFYKNLDDLKMNLLSGVYFLIPIQSKQKPIKLIK